MTPDAVAVRLAVCALSRPLAARGSGRSLGRGLPPAQAPEWVETGAWSRILDYPHADLTITVEPGVTLAALAETVGEHGAWFPADPLPSTRTVGGLLGADRRTPLAGGFGSIRDAVLGVAAITGKGERFRAGGRVVKNVAGYDLMRPLIGSLSAFAILTEVTLRLQPTPATWDGCRFPRSDAPAAFVPRVLRAGVVPAAIWDQRLGSEAVRSVLVAGSPARVQGQIERLRSLGGEVLGPQTAGEHRDAALRFAGSSPALRVWGGARLDAVPELFARLGAPLLVDLLSGLFWCDASEPPNIDALRGGLARRAHVHLATSRWEDARAAAWGSRPEETGLWRGMKHALDPDDNLVSGRFPGGI